LFSGSVGVEHSGFFVRSRTGVNFQRYGGLPENPWHGVHLARRVLDDALRRALSDTEVEVCQPETAIEVITERERITGVLTNRRRLHARVVIDASGDVGWLRRKIGSRAVTYSPQLLAVSGYCTMQNAPEHASFTIDDEGWTWENPSLDGRVFWVRISTTTPGERRQAATIGNRDHRCGTSCSRPVGRVVTWRHVHASGPGFRITGDAAARLDPSSGNGVLRALLTGMEAGSSAVEELQSGEPVQHIEEAYGLLVRSLFLRTMSGLGELYRSLPGSSAFAWPYATHNSAPALPSP
jgi:flavin-dependent dehydrogenase